VGYGGIISHPSFTSFGFNVCPNSIILSLVSLHHRPMTCKLFGDRQNICKVLKLVEGVTIKLDVFEASNNKVSLQTRLISSLLTSKARP
jgi:hypothetical protein